MTDLTAAIFTDESAARAHIEAIRWPDGPFCPHCGAVENIRKLEGKSHRPGLHQCNGCREHFTVTVGTVMERSHVPLHKWVLAFHLMAASKKGVSAHQLHRMLAVTYKTAWFMAHRIREAMADPGAAPVGGGGKVVEADETYFGDKEEVTKRTKKGKAAHGSKRPVVALVERGGGARAVHMPKVTAGNVAAVLARHADPASRLHTDESRLYAGAAARFAAHERVRHSAGEFVRYEPEASGGIRRVHTNSVEGFFGVFKRGMRGVYQHCGERHLQRYLDEFAFRHNTRSKLGIEDRERAALAVKGAEGKRLTYKRCKSAGADAQG